MFNRHVSIPAPRAPHLTEIVSTIALRCAACSILERGPRRKPTTRWKSFSATELCTFWRTLLVFLNATAEEKTYPLFPPLSKGIPYSICCRQLVHLDNCRWRNFGLALFLLSPSLRDGAALTSPRFSSTSPPSHRKALINTPYLEERCTRLTPVLPSCSRTW